MGIFRVERTNSLGNALTKVDTNSSDGSRPNSRRSSLSSLFRRKRPSVATIPVSSASSSPATTPRSTQTDLLPARSRKQSPGESRDNFPTIDLSKVYTRDKQTGEQVVDHTDMLHSLAHTDSEENLARMREFTNGEDQEIQTGEKLLARLPMKLWMPVIEDLSPADKASLSFTCKALREHLITYEAELTLPEHESERMDFLRRLDSSLPNHLFCFSCKTYHLRLNPGKEVLRPSNVANPIFDCPNSSNVEKRVSRVRLTSGRQLTFPYVQMVMRAFRFSPAHGMSIDKLSKRYREERNQWSHQTRYAIVNDHLLMRVISTSFAAAGLPPAGLRNLLYNPQEEFFPFFSVCPHWRDGELMNSVKCALSHLPKPIEGGGIDRVGREVVARIKVAASPIVTLCDQCRPMRRCPECPTEYLIEMKVAEDRSESDPRAKFKQALVVTRWSDLGDGITPGAAIGDIENNREWAACSGHLKDFDSTKALGKRAVSGVFESQFNVDLIPGQRIISMNPNKEKLGERGHNWY